MDAGLTERSVVPNSNWTWTEWVGPSFKLAGVGMLYPWIPLSPRNAPTSGREALAVTVVRRVVPSYSETVIGVLSWFLSAAQPMIESHPAWSTNPTKLGGPLWVT